MNITGNNSIINYVFDGGYSGFLSPDGLSFDGLSILDTGIAQQLENAGINPTGVTGKFVYFNSGFPIDSGYLPQGSIIASGASSKGSSISGYLYSRILSPLYGVCHGFGRDGDVWFKGYNFYNGFHPEGYFLPPFGQQLTVVKMNQDGINALAEDGSCANLNAGEYNDLFGIVSQTDSAVDAATDFLSDNAISFINSPSIACPQDLSPTFFWHEQQYKIIAGTSAAIAGHTFYNSNPIPTALDNFYAKTASRYQFSGETTSEVIDNGNGTTSQEVINHILYSGGRPIPAYSISGGTNIINTLTCPGILAETSVIAGEQTESQLLNAPDTLSTPSKSNFDFFNWWNIWHFLFKENSDGFPFDNSENNAGDNFGLQRTTTAFGSLGTQLFEYQLSDSDAYWLRRQCPEAISHLPHTLGGAIYACPSYHFDVPYYAATKKFGFYGTRFLNGCVSLELDYPLSGDNVNYPNVVEIDTGVTYTAPVEDEPDNDKGTVFGFSTYANLLRMAKAEENSADFYALNKTLFIWGNSGLIQQSSAFNSLTGNAGFLALFYNLCGNFSSVFPNGKTDLITGQPLFESGASSTLYATGNSILDLSNNQDYVFFKHELAKILNPTTELPYWDLIEDNYANAFLLNDNTVDTGFYGQLADAKQQRLGARYLENFVKGNPIDLYPTNKIHFSYDIASGFVESSSWGKSAFGFGAGQTFTDSGLTRRYFLGAYGNGQDVSGLSDYLHQFTSLQNSAFYPGYFDGGIGLELPLPTYYPAVTGNMISGDVSQSISDGWLAAGYNGVGQLRSNFSCFTPIYIQQPMPKMYCKVGQSPTFRVNAVDYHTIPEDKMGIRYPEIVYWMLKLKLCDSHYNNQYPLSYKWYRILKSDCANDFKNFLLTPNFDNVTASDPTGEWCALEGDGSTCTLIHPTECLPVFTPNPAFSSKYQDTPAYEIAKKNNFYMTLKKGAVKGDDDQYYYFCMTRGRFGIRISEASELFIEDWLKFDIAIQNGGNVGATPTVKFEANDYSISCSPTSVAKYAGFAQDSDAIPEDVVEEQLPPPNAGYGDVFSYKFVGMWGYRGVTQTYTPGTLNDTRGLKETWGRMLHYGALTQYQVALTQSDGDFLYGRNHLPVCSSSHTMASQQDGIRVVIDGIVHWANMQYPVVDTDGRYGVLWSKLGNAGELYIPSTSITNGAQVTISPGIGQWQWGNNLGTIHLFGWNTPESLLSQKPYPLSASDFQKLKQNLLGNGVLAGDNCGWHKNGLGRNMLYWIEGFSSFYLYCDPLKKKNVTNYNYMNPGLRQTNSSTQYFWLGKPSNSYLERYPLFGPYAYHWKMKQHNRDRNGNGVSEGFYSYGWNTNYTMQYDAPAIYGLSMKYGDTQRDKETIDAARTTVFGTNTQSVKTTRFGFTNGDGTSRIYGNIWIGNINGTEPNPTRDYVVSGSTNAETPEFNLYGCSDADLLAGNCFDPCLSMRYQMGLLAGGKKQDMTTFYPNGHGYRLVANAPLAGGSPANSTVQDASGIYFRGAFGTPHLQYLKTVISHSAFELNGFSPCFDGGAEHCNYITPTLHLGSSMYQESARSDFLNNMANAAAAITLGGIQL